MVGFVVELHSDPMTTVTDENGRYTFNDVAYTNHELIIKTPQGEKVATFELNFSQGKEFSSAKSDKGANITYTQKTETVTLEVTLNPDQSGAVISEVSASSQPQTNGFLSVIGSVLLWVGGGILVIMLLLILANKRKVKE
jgi:hypothetical protein